MSPKLFQVSVVTCTFTCDDETFQNVDKISDDRIRSSIGGAIRRIIRTFSAMLQSTAAGNTAK